MKSQTVVEVIGYISDATAQVRNDGTMLHRANSSLLKRVRTCLS